VRRSRCRAGAARRSRRQFGRTTDNAVGSTAAASAPRISSARR
jgi:hypothetical protein